MREVEEEEEEVKLVFKDRMEVYMHKALLSLLSPFLRGLLPDMACPTLLLPDHDKESMELLLHLLKKGKSGDENLVPSSLADLVSDMGLNVPLDKSAGGGGAEVTVLEEHVTLEEEETQTENVESVSTEPPSKKLRMTRKEGSGSKENQLAVQGVRVMLRRLKLSKTKQTVPTEPNILFGKHVEDRETTPKDLKLVKTTEQEKKLSKETRHGFALKRMSVRLQRMTTKALKGSLMSLQLDSHTTKAAETQGTEHNGVKQKETRETKTSLSCVKRLENITQWIDHHIRPAERVLEFDQKQNVSMLQSKEKIEGDKKKRSLAKADTQRRRNDVTIECGSNEEKPELTLEIIQKLLLSQEQKMVDSSLIQDESKSRAEEEEEDDIVELEPPKKRLVPLVDLELEDEGDTMLFKCIDAKISELEKDF